jgi:hypothetical protein
VGPSCIVPSSFPAAEAGSTERGVGSVLGMLENAGQHLTSWRNRTECEGAAGWMVLNAAVKRNPVS